MKDVNMLGKEEFHSFTDQVKAMLLSFICFDAQSRKYLAAHRKTLNSLSSCEALIARFNARFCKSFEIIL